MKQSGDIIAYIHHTPPDIIMYPRGRPFISKLSGTVSIILGSETVKTSVDLRDEIRRGDAIMIADKWYRVSTQISNAAANNQPIRAQAPGSVSSTEENNDRKNDTFTHKFTADQLPLSRPVLDVPSPDLIQSDVNGILTVCAYKHGTTNDLRKQWGNTFLEMRSKNLTQDDRKFQEELLRLRLVTQSGVLTSNIRQRPVEDKDSKSLKKPRRQQNRFSRMTNTHLKGTITGDLLASTAVEPPPK